MKISSLAIGLSVAMFALPATAQCSPRLSATVHVTGASSAVYAAIAMPNGDLVIAGHFTGVQGTPANNIARRRGGTWMPLAGGLDGAVNALAILPNGDLVAGGTFSQAGGVTASKVARWDGTHWTALGAGMTGAQVPGLLAVRVLLVRPNGSLVAGGHFLAADGVPANNIAAWNGTAWSALAGGISGGVSPYSPPPFVDGLANLPNGDLLATGGALTVQRWDDTAWSAMNAGITPASWQHGPQGLFVSDSGNLFAFGTEQLSVFSPATPFVKQWNGSAWTNYGVWLPASGVPLALAELPTGDLVLGGIGLGSSQTGTANQVLRSSGTGWTAFADTPCRGLSLERDGSLRVVTGGPLAELVSSCPATITSIGAPCSGSLGPHTLTADSLPWLGTTFGTVTGAVPGSAIALAVWSLSPTVLPLSTVTPVAGLGCEGLVVTDFAEVLLPRGNEVHARIALPLSPALAGLVVHHYVAVMEVGRSGALVHLTGTGRLQLTLGTY